MGVRLGAVRTVVVVLGSGEVTIGEGATVRREAVVADGAALNAGETVG